MPLYSFEKQPKWQLTRWGQAMAEENRPFVLYAYGEIMKNKRWRRSLFSLTNDDILSACGLGLIQAVATFNPNAGFTFSTYAFTCISQAVGNDKRRAEEKRKKQSYVNPHEMSLMTIDPRSGDAVGMADEMMDLEAHASGKKLQILTLRFQGHSVREIGEEIGCTYQYVCQVIKLEAERIGLPKAKLHHVHKRGAPKSWQDSLKSRPSPTT